MKYTPEEIKAAGLDDFRVFLAQVWHFLRLPSPTVVQNDIAKWLQNPGNGKLVLSAFRGVGKTYITAAFVVWLLFLNPDLKILVVSANEQYATKFSKFVKKIIYGMPMLENLHPREDENSAEAWTVKSALPAADPSVKSVGITGQLTGSRADIIIADDVEVPKNSKTIHLREWLNEATMEFASILKPLPESRIIYLGTPQVEDSLYGKLVTERGYTMRVWPAEIPEKPENYNGRLAPMVMRRIEAGWKPGTPVDPERFNRETLAVKKAEYGLAGYALQFMLDTNLSDAEKRPLKLSNLLVADIDPDQGHVKLVWSRDRVHRIEDLACGGLDGDYYVAPCVRSPEMEKWQGTVMAIDPSGRGTDETAYAIVRYLYGTLYLVEVGGFLDGFSEETLDSIAERAAYQGVNYVIAEENYGGGMFTSLLKPHLAKERRLPDGTRRTGGSFDEEYNGWSHGTKEFRILDTLEPVVANHRLVVDRRVIEEDLKVLNGYKSSAYSFVYQFTRMERERGCLAHEDRLEAVAMAVAYWTERMDRDRDRAVQQTKQKAIMDELRLFKKSLFHVRGKLSA